MVSFAVVVHGDSVSMVKPTSRFLPDRLGKLGILLLLQATAECMGTCQCCPEVGTKPHGHGDIHFLLHSKGMAKRWLEEGRRWVLFFQDTNTLYLTTFLCSLGVSAKHGLRANVVAMPRKAKEAVGSIARLTHSDGKCIVANVEYNQLLTQRSASQLLASCCQVSSSL